MATFLRATHFLARVNILKITAMYVMVTPPFVFVCVCACSFACNHVYIRKYIYMQSDVPSPFWLEGGGFISLFLLVSTFPFHFCFLVVHLPLWLFFLRLHKTTSIYTPLALDFPPSTACLLYLAVTVSHCSSLVRTQSMHCALSSLLCDHVNPSNLISEQKLSSYIPICFYFKYKWFCKYEPH